MQYLYLPCIDRVLFYRNKSGVRNIMARQLAFACLKDNLPKEKALEQAKSFYARYDKKDFSYAEVERCFNWAYKHDKNDDDHIWGHGRTYGDTDSLNDISWWSYEQWYDWCD